MALDNIDFLQGSEGDLEVDFEQVDDLLHLVQKLDIASGENVAHSGVFPRAVNVGSTKFSATCWMMRLKGGMRI